MLKIAIDAMGGDFGPEPIIEGLIAALKKIITSLQLQLVRKMNFYHLSPITFCQELKY